MFQGYHFKYYEKKPFPLPQKRFDNSKYSFLVTGTLLSILLLNKREAL